MGHVISAIRPAWALPGGVISIDGVHLPVPADGPPHVLVGARDAHVAAASHRSLRVVVPSEQEGGRVPVRIDELPGETVFLQVAQVLATGVHQVDSPAFGRDGRLYCTMSGQRGAKAPVPLYRIGADGVREPIAVDVSNPTSLAVGPDGLLYISSRFDGHVFRMLDDDRVELYATELGTATGLAFGPDGALFVGDRSGAILRVSAGRQVESFASIPPSVAAFHLAMGPDGCLYVSVPSLSTHDTIYRITPDRLVEPVNSDLGRPQGLAFDSTGALYVVEALAGSAGVYRLDVSRALPTPELVLSAPSLVGLAFDPAGGLVLANAETVWRLDVPLTPVPGLTRIVTADDLLTPLPLSGLRVVDLTRLLPGAFATLMLAELGAEVVKVEDPAGGDPMRHLPPLIDGRGIYDTLLGRGKKSVAIDLKSADGRRALDALIATADIVAESFRPATAVRLGVDGGRLRGMYPRLIHCAITGYGQSGPYADHPGHDLNYVSLSGLLVADGRPPGELPRMFIADVGGGAMSSVIGILAALLDRERHGRGASLDISMHDAALYWVMLPAARDLVDGGERATGDLPTFGAHASYNIYRTRDGRLIALGALERKFWVAFCAAAGRPDLAARHETGAEDQAALMTEVRALFATRTRDEWLALLDGHDVCLTPVNTPAEALRDPHVQARGTVRRQAGLRSIRPPFLRRAPDLSPAPAVGEHTRTVLSPLGF